MSGTFSARAPGDRRIYVAGHRGMVGSALCRALRTRGYRDVVTRSREELDLTDQPAVHAFMCEAKVDHVFIAAARVGGILANSTFPAQFLYDNLVIESNLIEGARRAGVQNLLFLGSSCIYPRDCPQPMREDYLLTGPLEPTNEPYAIAKLAGIKLCEAYNRQYGTRYVCVMPTNLYGPNDNYDLRTSHVLPALIRKAHEAKASGRRALEVWGTGRARREFLHVDDLANACLFLMERGVGEGLYNVGTGVDVTVRELAELVMRATGFEGTLAFDPSKPDGTPRKLLDVSRLAALGWRARIGLEEGIAATCAEFDKAAEALTSGART